MRRILVALMLVLLVPVGAQAETLEKGVSFHETVWQGKQVYWLKVYLKHRSIRPAVANDRFPLALRPPSFDAVKAQAIAAVNSDFMLQPHRRQPRDAFMLNKELWTSGRTTGGGIGYLQGRHHAWAGPISLFMSLWHGPKTSRIFHWNAGVGNGLVAFTPRGGGIQVPTPGACYARLKVASKIKFAGDGTVRHYKVDTQTCGTPPKVLPRTVVLERTMKFDLDNPISIHINVGHPKVSSIIGGMTDLVAGGRNVAPRVAPLDGSHHDGYYYRPCPRTALGVSQDGTVGYAVVVDGLPANEAGIRLPGLAHFMVTIGVNDAINLDGGGSAMMWTRRGKVVSHPSYGTVRSVIFASVVK